MKCCCGWDLTGVGIGIDVGKEYCLSGALLCIGAAVALLRLFSIRIEGPPVALMFEEVLTIGKIFLGN